MPRPTFHSHHPQKWAGALRREMQTAIGQQLRAEYELPQELPLELTALLTAWMNSLSSKAYRHS